MINKVSVLKESIRHDTNVENSLFCYFDETSKYFYVLISIKRNLINASINITSKDKNDEFFLELPKVNKAIKNKKDQTITTLLKATVKNNSEFFLCEGKSKTQIFSVKDDFLKVDNSKIVNFNNINSKTSCSNRLFIGGSPKSGTTWLERALNFHPDILMTGENLFYEWPSTDSFKNFISSSPRMFFQSFFPEKGFEDLHVSLFYEGYLSKTFEIFSEVSGIKVIGDKTPSYSQSHFIYNNFKYLHCVRHPLDYAISSAYHTSNIEISKGSKDKLYTNLIETSEVQEFFNQSDYMEIYLNDWIRINTNIFELAKFNKNIFICHYEDLLNSFEERMSEILNFIGLDASQEILKIIKERSSFKSLSGGRKQGQENTKDFFRKGIQGEYMQVLDKDFINKMEKNLIQKWEQCPYILKK